jgi:CDP-diacylglycerol--serine O-phosphatidyltransferase
MALPESGRYIRAMRDPLFQPLDPLNPSHKRRRFRAIPVRTLLPNLVTLLALCAGLTAIRLAAEGRFDWALAGIVAAAVLDGVDGRIARMLKGTSRFGAELDSLADFVNFGVGPGLILYFWELHVLKSPGWIAAMVFAICAGLRLARFNVMLDDPDKPAWAANFFTGIPAPAGAICVLLPLYLQFLNVQLFTVPPVVTFFYTLLIGGLMVSRLPVFSGKKIGTRVPTEMVLPVFVVVVALCALFISYPWEMLTVVSLAFLATLPLGWMSYRNHLRRDAEALAAKGVISTPVPADAVTLSHGTQEPSPRDPADGDRPARLN